MEIISRFFAPDENSFFLFGPRGTGKSTLLKNTFPVAYFIDLLDPIAFRTYISKPEHLSEVLAGNIGVETIVIDEIQKVPSLLDVVHKIIEDKTQKPPQFILTGSSARKLKRTGVNLLAGRALLRKLHPFMAAELGRHFNMLENLRYGMLPIVSASKNRKETLDSYVSLYLREEVHMEGLVRNIGGFSRFLEALSFSHASLLNTSQVARECQTGQKTAEGYLEILEDLLLGFRVKNFTRRAKRQLVAHPKFYFVDCGIYNTLRPRGPLDQPGETGGAALEGLVAQHLRAWIDYSRNGCELYFWRTRAGTEVDFVIYGPSVFTAIEVKSSRSVYNNDVRPLKAFRTEYPEAKVGLLYGGKERLRINDILCIPCEDFLRNLVPGEALPLE
ncbi:MAG: ATP-binding protein [Candidatus Xenobiia bacterium LiM19]